MAEQVGVLHRLELTGGRRLCLIDGEPLAYVSPIPDRGGHRWCCRCGREYLENTGIGPESETDMAAKKKGGIGASAPQKSKKEPKPARELKQPDRAVIVIDGEIGKAIRAESVKQKLSLTKLGELMWAAYSKA